MKKLIFLAAFLIMAGAIFGQTLQKGNVLALHVITANLDPDVTYNQWKNFGLTKSIPAFNKEFQGDVIMYFAEVDRGDDENGLSLIFIFKSLEVRDKYFTKEGTPTELWNSKWEKVNQSTPEEERNKLGTSDYSGIHIMTGLFNSI